MPSGRPGIVDDSFWDSPPNIFPAGTGPWVANQPTSSWPNPGNVSKEFGGTWLSKVDLPREWEQDPRGLLEPGTGFGPDGRSSALQLPGFPEFPFFMFPGYGNFGYQPPPPQGDGGGPPETDYLGTALKSGADLLRGFSPKNTPPYMSADEFAGLVRSDAFGYEPQFDLQGNTTVNGEVPIEGTPFYQNQFNLGGSGPISVSEMIPFKGESILTGSPLFGAPPGPAMGFGVEPGFNLTGEGLPGALNASEFSTGANTALNAAGNPSLLTSGQAGIGAAALAGAPFAFNALGLPDAARLTGSPAFQGPAGAFLAAASGNPITAAIAGFALPTYLSINKMIHGNDIRKARDARTVQEAGKGMQDFMNLAKYNPQYLNELGFYSFDPTDRLTEVVRNNRLGLQPAQIESMKHDLEAFKQLREEIRTGNSPTALQNMNVGPPMSEGELWRRLASQESERQLRGETPSSNPVFAEWNRRRLEDDQRQQQINDRG